MARTRPKWGWYESRPALNTENLGSEGFWENVSRDLGIESGEASHRFTESATIAVYDYLHEKLSVPRPTTGELRAALEIFQKQVSALAQTLRQLDEHTRRALDHARVYRKSGDVFGSGEMADEDRQGAPQEPRRRDNVAALTDEIEEFERDASLLLSSMKPERRGRPGNNALDYLIQGLASAYDAAGFSPHAKMTYDGKEHAYWSPFLDLVAAVLDEVDPEHGLTNNALGEAIRRSLGHREPMVK